MTYTIRQVAEKMGVTVPNGNRVFKDEDFQGLNIIICMKNSGTPIRDIKGFMDL